MKNLVICFAFVAVISLMMVRVEASSMPRCPDQCDQSRCPSVNCECGTVKDSCNCCDFCRVCAGEPCHLIRSDVCQEGYSCTHPAGSDYMQQMTNPGTCLRTQE